MYRQTTLQFLLALSLLGAVVVGASVNLTAVFGPHLSPGALIFLPSSANYSTEVTPRWSSYDPPSYVGAIKPATEADVQTIVRIASAHNIPFLATGGGHGVSTGFSNVQNAIDIDLGNFKSVEVDAANDLLTIGGAVTFGQIFQPLYDVGKEIQTGNSACVGMVGATLGAGVGTLQGLHGLIIDALKSVRLVTASGALITVSKTQHPDLFWALRGAGANFGIVTSATYNIHNATNGGQILNADFLFPASANRSVWELLKSYDDYIPAPLSFTVSASYNHTSNQARILVNIVYFGTQAAAQPYLDPLIALNPTATKIVTVPWPQTDYVASFGIGATACNDGWVNTYSVGLVQTDVPTFEAFFANLSAFSLANPLYIGVLVAERYSTVVTLQTPDSETVYPGRNIKSHLLFQNRYPPGLTPNASVAASIDTFNRNARSAFAKTSGFSDGLHLYINYDHGDEGPAVWYGARNLRKLRVLKALWDPRRLFGAGNPVA